MRQRMPPDEIRRSTRSRSRSTRPCRARRSAHGCRGCAPSRPADNRAASASGPAQHADRDQRHARPEQHRRQRPGDLQEARGIGEGMEAGHGWRDIEDRTRNSRPSFTVSTLRYSPRAGPVVRARRPRAAPRAGRAWSARGRPTRAPRSARSGACRARRPAPGVAGTPVSQRSPHCRSATIVGSSATPLSVS